MRRILCFLLVFTFCATMKPGPAYGNDNKDMNNYNAVQIIRSKVLECKQDGQGYLLTVQIIDGLHSGKTLELPYVSEHPGISQIVINPGDQMLLQLESDDKNNITGAYVSDYVRDRKNTLPGWGICADFDPNWRHERL